ncbi:MAG: tetratricopeptide repeat protein, partial [Bacteroidia bacterium]
MFSRKIIFILCLIFIAAVIVPAQISTGKRDSINKKIRSSHDTLKVLTLCKLSRMMVGNSPDSALILADSAFKIAKRNKYQQGLAQSYANMGSAQNTIGKYDIAIKNFISAAELFEKLKNKYGLSNVLNSIGNAYLGVKNNDKAYEYYLKAYDIANQEPINENMVAVTSFGIGSILTEQGKSAEAISYFRKAEASFRKQNILNYAAMAVSMIGETYFRDSNYVEAEKTYLSVVPVFRETQDDYGLATALANLGAIDLERKKYASAIDYYKEAIDINFKRNA